MLWGSAFDSVQGFGLASGFQPPSSRLKLHRKWQPRPKPSPRVHIVYKSTHRLRILWIDVGWRSH